MSPNLQKLFSIAQNKQIDLGLDRVAKVNSFCGSPACAFASIHVAGTNGKGSTTLKIARCLTLGGHKVGLYTSPHIASFRERISINGASIPLAIFERHLERVFSAMESLQIDLTFFEIITLVAFLYFQEERVDVAVIEVGLGGRLDATNIVRSIFSVITSIDYDHTQILGSTLEEIAFEKGGIIKEKVPLLLGPKAAKIALLQKLAKAKNSPCYLVEDRSLNFEESNRRTVQEVLAHLPFQYDLEGLKSTPPCRFEVLGNVILDVAHNPEAFRALLFRLHEEFPNQKFLFLIAFSEDKEVERCLEILIPHASFFILTRPSHGKRGLAPEVLAHLLDKRGVLSYLVIDSIEESGRQALASQEKVVATGSFYIMKELRRLLGIQEEWDPVSISQ